MAAASALVYRTGMNLPDRYVVCCSRLVTCDDVRETERNPLGVIEDAGLFVDRSTLQAIGPRKHVIEMAEGAPVVLDWPGVITPGLVDAHTHAVWAGSRHDEYALRMSGAGYEQIAAAGGGIAATMNAVRAATAGQLASSTWARLRRMAALGTTTCEVKSGYGLDLANEIKQLRVIEQLASDVRLPRVIPTYLALHAIPPEGKAHRDEWVDRVAREWVPEIAKLGLARYVDAYIDRNAFTVEEARRVFDKAYELKLGVRAHVGQFADVGGADLAADGGAASIDHVEHVSHDSLLKLAASKTRVVLLPVASYTLKQTPPPVQAIREAGVPMVIATDSNPGTAPTESLPLAMAMGVRDYGLTPEEVLIASTREAAASLGLHEVCGRLAPGFDADFVAWSVPHERVLVQPWGSQLTRLVVSRGRALHSWE